MSNGFSDQPHARARGKAGEDDAVRWLAAQGYEVLARNVVNHGGEIDVVAKDGDTLCFVEIKARDGDRYGPAVEAVGFAADLLGRHITARALHFRFPGKHPREPPLPPHR